MIQLQCVQNTVADIVLDRAPVLPSRCPDICTGYLFSPASM